MNKPDGINLLTDTTSLAAINGKPSANTTVEKNHATGTPQQKLYR